MSDNNGMAKVIEGYRHFNEAVYPENRELFEKLKNKQKPQVLFITCADSRIDPTLITHTEPGDLFICRNIGNIVPAYGEMMGGVSAVVEYAVVALKITDIIVCGHSDCGAMKALGDLESPSLAAMPMVKGWMRNASAAFGVVRAKHPDISGDVMTEALNEENVLLQLQHLRTHPGVIVGIRSGTLRLHGWIYDIGNGQVRVFDEATGRYMPIEQVLGTGTAHAPAHPAPAGGKH